MCFLTVLILFLFSVIVYPIKTVFSKGCPTIVIKESCLKILKPATPTQTETAELTEYEESRLNDGTSITNC